MSLFEENLGKAYSGDELKIIREKRANYDSVYVSFSAYQEDHHIKFKNEIEKWWNMYKPFVADQGHFKSEFKLHFHERVWELYLGVLLLNKGFKLEKADKKGFDIKINHNGRIIWVEATCPDRGIVDAVPPKPILQSGVMHVGGGDIEQINRPKIIRISNAVSDKIKHYDRLLKDNIINPNESFVVAVNGYKISGFVDMADYLIRQYCFSAGLISIPLDTNKEPYYMYKHRINKNVVSGVAYIDCDIFCTRKYTQISGMILCMNDVLNCFTEPVFMGDNFESAINPFAKNPLPEDFLNFGTVWTMQDSLIYPTRYLQK